MRRWPARLFGRPSIVRQLTIAFAALVLIPVLLGVFVSSRFVTERILADASNYAESTVTQVARSIDSRTDDISRLVELVASQQQIISLVRQSHPITADYILRYSVAFDFVNALYSSRELDGLRIIATQDMPEKWPHFYTVGNLPEEHRLLLAGCEGDYLQWVGPLPVLPFDAPGAGSAARARLCAIKPVRALTSVMAYIEADVDASALFAPLRGVELPEESRLFLAADGGNAPSHSTGSLPYLAEPSDPADAARHLSAQCRLEYLPYAVVLEMDRRLFVGQVQAVRAVAAGAGLCTLLGIVALYLGLIRIILARLRRLVRGLKTLGPQGLGIEIADDKKDEIGVLIGHFNDMSRRVAQLVADVVQEEKARREAELEMLQYQIHPHFLYNVLDAFYARAQESGDTLLGDSIMELARMLRYSLNREKESLSTLGAEIDHASAYITLQSLRYEGRVDFHAEMENWTRGVLCPRFVLQPLVENCVVHGRRDDRYLEILVAVSEAEEGLRVEISDNGDGMDAGRLSWLKASLGSDPGKGEPPGEHAVGMVNVDRRLRAYGGSPGALAVESTPGIGTSVAFILPEAYENDDRSGS